MGLVAGQVRRRPDAPAVVDHDRMLSYGELADAADLVAAQLTDTGLRPGGVVGLTVPPSATAIAAAMGVLHAGGVLLPCDPSQPPLRQQQILQSSDAGLVVAAGARTDAVQVVATDGRRVLAGAEVDPAYVIYTSGSTGTPKGVVCSHPAWANVARAQHGIVGIVPADRVAQLAPWCVDAALFEMVLALTAGATLCVARPEDRYPGPPAERFLHENDVTVAVMTPSTLRALRSERLTNLRLIISAGEALPTSVARPWTSSVRLLNAYGPTEGTIWSTWAEVTGDEEEGDGTAPIGIPIGGCEVTVRGPDLEPVGAGQRGEICLGGIGVAVGYLDHDDTAEDRFTTGQGGRLLRTGDIGSIDAQGRLLFHGRDDDQVKLGGLRVELGEVREALRSHPAVDDCVVRPDGGRLVAHLVPARDTSVDTTDLIEWMERRLPLAMVPTLYVEMDSLPLTAWGKVDVAALPDASAVRPRTSVDRTLTPTEALLLRVAIDTLQFDQLGPDDDLFMLGLTSLSLARLMVGLSEGAGIDVEPVDIFEHPTISALASVLDDRARLSPTQLGR
ncbi:non-ribosomal peptide synthetase [Micromonospora sp. WMMD1102]|uniref:non-ribosomal peptide synthetase n=1 Tax=Micromonospora sp. WMMD1102 TaxID=3016105 RepID=UPI002415620D|nr:non-ribosomal peptide synthetase [Micromonospora sp. WMMD1102]MDG4789715.1 non-ribosomal peptide synthetase [Micromonospora sp. WMMD1102]